MLVGPNAATLALLLDILRHAGDAVIVIDRQFRVVLFNEKAEEIFGWPAAEMLGRTLDCLLPEAVSAAGRHHRHIAAFASGAVAQRLMGLRREVRGRRRDGREFPAEVSIARTGSGTEPLMIAVLRDISGRLEEQERIHSLNGRLLTLTEQLRTVLAHTTHGVAYYDAQLRLVVWNRRFQDLYALPDKVLRIGATAAELIAGAGVISGVPGLDLSPAIATRMASLARPERLTFRRRLPDGRLVEVTQVPLPDGGRMTTHADITGHDRRETELRQARDRAEAADRFRAELIASVTHELRSPFNAIIGFAGLLRDAGTETAPALVREYARYIEEAARDLLGNIDRILELSQAGNAPLPLQDSPVPLKGFLSDVLMRWRPAAAEAGVTLCSDLEPGLPLVQMDAGRLGEALDCLLSNAVRFSPAGGTVMLAARRAEGVEITLTDQGPGMPPERLAEAMQPFRQLDQSIARRQGGMGLGLPLAKRLVEAHGARLELASEPGQGTRATIGLPPQRVVTSSAPVIVADPAEC